MGPRIRTNTLTGYAGLARSLRLDPAALTAEVGLGLADLDVPDLWIPAAPAGGPRMNAVFDLRDRLAQVLADAARMAQGEADYLARVEAALAEEPEAGMTLLGRTVSWTETNDEGRTLTCAVELQERGAFPRYVKAVYRLATDEGEPDGEERLFDAAGEL